MTGGRKMASTIKKMKINDLTLSGKELDTAYKKYLSSYGNKAATIKREYGLKMWDEKYNKETFAALYEASARTMMLEKGWDKIKDTTVIKFMVDRQATELTDAQARAFQEGMRQQGKYMTIKEIYKSAPELIKEMYEQLKASGVQSSYERQTIISSAFFGSPA